MLPPHKIVLFSHLVTCLSFYTHMADPEQVQQCGGRRVGCRRWC